MKKSQLKPIIKAIIEEAVMSNIFRVIIYGTQEQRDTVNKEFVRMGGGKLFASPAPIDLGTSSFTIRNTQALQLIEKVLRQLGWDRKGPTGHKDITWTAPDWRGLPTQQKVAGGVSTPPPVQEVSGETGADWQRIYKLAEKYLANYEAHAVPRGSVSYEEKMAFKDGFGEGYGAAKKGE